MKPFFRHWKNFKDAWGILIFYFAFLSLLLIEGEGPVRKIFIFALVVILSLLSVILSASPFFRHKNKVLRSWFYKKSRI